MRYRRINIAIAPTVRKAIWRHIQHAQHHRIVEGLWQGAGHSQHVTQPRLADAGYCEARSDILGNTSDAERTFALDNEQA
jgi:hypothetical protein